MSHLSDPDRLERFAIYVTDDPPNVMPWEVAVALNDAAERIRSLQARLGVFVRPDRMRGTTTPRGTTQ